MQDQRVKAEKEVSLYREHLEDLVNEKTALLQAVMSSMSQGVAAFDQDLNLIICNNHYLQIRDYPEQFNQTGKPFEKFIRYDMERDEFGDSDGDKEEIIKAQIERAKKFEHHHFERKRPNGSYLEISGGPIPGGGFVSTYSDITERKKAEKALKESEQRLGSILESSPIGVCIVVKGKPVFTNDRMLQVLGRTKENFIDQSAATLLADPEHEHIINSKLVAEGILEDEEIDYRQPDGSIVSSLSTFIPMEYGTEKGLLFWVYDITERKKAEQKLAQAMTLINDSIQYASRIQRSILPSEKFITSRFLDHFIIWEPRDLVGGDTYWCRSWGDGTLIALGDCTGHGVPGAFMTLIANGALDQAMENSDIGDTAAVIAKMHQQIQTELGQDQAEGQSDDGLELGVCYIPPDSTTLNFSGARFSLFVTEGGEVEEVKGDKSGIGYRGIPHDQSFTCKSVEIGMQRSFFMSSDGLIDQIGGEKRRGFGKKRLKEILHRLHTKPMTDIKEYISVTLDIYQGEEVRRDDVTVMGFRVQEGKTTRWQSWNSL